MGLGQFVISSVRLVINLSGLLLARIRLLVVHAGVVVVSLAGASLALPSFVTPQFKEFSTLGRVLRTTLPTAKGGVVHLFVVYGCQGAEEDAEKLAAY